MSTKQKITEACETLHFDFDEATIDELVVAYDKMEQKYQESVTSSCCSLLDERKSTVEFFQLLMHKLVDEVCFF